MNTEERERALLALVDDYRERECRKLLDDARERAREFVRRRFETERAALHDRVAAERARALGLIQSARAEQATRERRRSEQLDSAMTEAAWPLLRAALRGRWSNAHTRGRWVDSALERCLALLPAQAWEIRHAPDWPASERAEIERRLAAHLPEPVRFESDAALEAGLIVRCGGAVLDASLDGLTRDRGRVEARLLALWHAPPHGRGRVEHDRDLPAAEGAAAAEVHAGHRGSGR
jgi:hypothetical protein